MPLIDQLNRDLEERDETIISLEARLDELEAQGVNDNVMIVRLQARLEDAERDRFWIECSKDMGWELYGAGFYSFHERYPR